MALIPFSPPPGLNSDDTTFKAEGRWVNCRNVRFVGDSPQVIGEFKSLFSALGSAVVGIFAWDRSGVTYIAYGLEASVRIAAGIVSPTDRTPVGMGTGYTAYAFAPWGSTLLFVPSSKTLYEQAGTSTATEVTQAPNKITWMLVTAERQVLALGCNEEVSGTFNDLCIRGSDLEDYTDWTTSSTNNAFEHILEGGGKIVTGRLIGQYVAVWTDNSLHLGQFIGDPGQTYRFDRVAESCGLVGPNAVAVVGSRAYWVGPDHRIHTWSPSEPVTVVPCQVFQEFDTTLSNAGPVANATICVVHVSKFNEIWIYLPASDTYFAVSLDTWAWSKGDQERTAALCSDLLQNPMSNTYATNLITADSSGLVYASECGADVSATGPTDWSIESGGQYLDNGGRRVMIRSIRPDFKTASGSLPANTVSLTLFVRDRAQSTAVTKGPYSIAAGATKKDFRASGMIAAVKFSQSTVDRELRLGKIVFDAVPMGER